MKDKINTKKAFFDLLLQIRVKMKKVTEAAESVIPITPTQIIILRILVDQGEIGQGDLVKLMKRDKSQITRLVHDLVDKTLVIKSPDPKDGRRYLLKAAPMVYVKMQEIGVYEDRLMTDLLAGFSEPERKQLDLLLVKMNTNLLN